MSDPSITVSEFPPDGEAIQPLTEQEEADQERYRREMEEQERWNGRKSR